MIVGKTFAYGHIPKTGGDAVHVWFSRVPGVEVDSTDEARKHDFFWQRDLRKKHYVLSIRRLPHWALSYLHELRHHPESSRGYGIPAGSEVRAEHACLLQPDWYLMQHQFGGRKIDHWLRMEHLFDDVVQFIDQHVAAVTPELRDRLAAASTKGQRAYDHDVSKFFEPNQLADLYASCPVWTAIEAKVYGSLLTINN